MAGAEKDETGWKENNGGELIRIKFEADVGAV
jgi:hypothetical protein